MRLDGRVQARKIVAIRPSFFSSSGVHNLCLMGTEAHTHTTSRYSKGALMANTSARTANLLVVDDDPSMVRLLTKIIERELEGEVELTSLVDPKEARQWIESNVVDIMVTDLEMPGIDGLELLRCAKHKNPCTQVLFMTGHSTLGALSNALESGATDYLLKPLDQAEFIELVSDALRRQRRWKEALAGTMAARRKSQAAST